MPLGTLSDLVVPSFELMLEDRQIRRVDTFQSRSRMRQWSDRIEGAVAFQVGHRLPSSTVVHGFRQLGLD